MLMRSTTSTTSWATVLGRYLCKLTLLHVSRDGSYDDLSFYFELTAVRKLPKGLPQTTHLNYIFIDAGREKEIRGAL
jgi:hypothetical protein